MRFLLINPNTSAGVTELVLAAARRLASPGTELAGVTGAFGARYIASRAAAAIAGHAALDAYARAGAGMDGILLACFGDPGLGALREVATAPVVGMAEASCHRASALGRRFSIVTGGERWGPMLTEFVAALGLSERLASVRTVAPTGADIAADPAGAHALLADACNLAAAEDGADIVILGGAGLVGIAAHIAGRVPVPLVDCLEAAMAALEAKAHAGARQSDAGPPPVETAGLGDDLRRMMERAPGR